MSLAVRVVFFRASAAAPSFTARNCECVHSVRKDLCSDSKGLHRIIKLSPGKCFTELGSLLSSSVADSEKLRHRRLWVEKENTRLTEKCSSARCSSTVALHAAVKILQFRRLHSEPTCREAINGALLLDSNNERPVPSHQLRSIARWKEKLVKFVFSSLGLFLVFCGLRCLCERLAWKTSSSGADGLYGRWWLFYLQAISIGLFSIGIRLRGE